MSICTSTFCFLENCTWWKTEQTISLVKLQWHLHRQHPPRHDTSQDIRGARQQSSTLPILNQAEVNLSRAPMAGSTHSTFEWLLELHSAHHSASSDCFIAVTWSVRRRNSSLRRHGGNNIIGFTSSRSKAYQCFKVEFSNPQKCYLKKKVLNLFCCVKTGGKNKLNLKSQMCICPTWEFGLLAGVAGCSRVTWTHQFIRNNRTFSLSTLCNEGTERSLGPNRKKWQSGT